MARFREYFDAVGKSSRRSLLAVEIVCARARLFFAEPEHSRAFRRIKQSRKNPSRSITVEKHKSVGRVINLSPVVSRPPSVISRCRLDCLHKTHRRKRFSVFFFRSLFSVALSKVGTIFMRGKRRGGTGCVTNTTAQRFESVVTYQRR